MPSMGPQLDSLDDHTLLAVFNHLDPLPDLFLVAATCRRFRDLALDRRSWLYVTHAATNAAAASPAVQEQQRRRRRSLQPARAPSAASLGASPAAVASAAAAGEEEDAPHWYRSSFATLEAAVDASRPGDTILLEAGPVPHLVPSPLMVPHPVHILGGGVHAGECVVHGARGIESLLDFRASGRVANLTLRATAGACVAHTRGRLTVQGCTLECDARGLPHLAAPLLTRAVSTALPPATPAAAAGRLSHLPAGSLAPLAAQHAAGVKRTAATAAGQAAMPMPAAKRPCTGLMANGAAAAGAGVLRVVETRIKAQGLAVDLRGTGRLASVRAIYSTGHALVWLDVDSANSAATSAATGAASVAASSSWGATPGGNAVQAAAQGSGSGEVAGSQAGIALPSTPLPSWIASKAAHFDPAAFQKKMQQLAAPDAAASQQRLPPQLATQPPPQEQQQQQQQPRRGESCTASMELKAEAWCQHHHTSLAAESGVEGQPVQD